jgi:hypothetical protein
MDRDMHYYGTYALARAGGVAREPALRIAMAAEYVDDSDRASGVVLHPVGARFEHETTAHHPSDLGPNNDLDDQIRVWVPFHFVPGAEGADFAQRLVCRKDSAVAREMVAHHLDEADREYAVEVIGMTAHVYADTFAHYGFSGVSSHLNRVDGLKIEVFGSNPLVERLNGKLDSFFARFGNQGGLVDDFRGMFNRVLNGTVSSAAEAATNLKRMGALGHGAVATFPDQPFLRWRYSYQRADLWGADATVVDRNNPGDFLEGSRALHSMFKEFSARRPDLADTVARRDFDAIEEMVAAIVATPAERDERSDQWKRALAEGQFTGATGETVPDYDPFAWRAQLASLSSLNSPSEALGVPAYRFQQAAAMHRQFVLRELLPKHGIVLI